MSHSPAHPRPAVPADPPAPPRTAGRAAVAAALALAALSVGGYLALAATRPDMWWLGDLKVYRAGGRAVVRGAGDLYSMSVGGARLPFTYTPWAALSFTPLGWLPWGLVRHVWTAASLGCLAACACLAWRLTGLTGRRLVTATALTTALLLWTDPVQETLRFGQINLALMLVVLFDLARPDTARTKGAGVGLAAALKLTPAIFIAYLLLTGRRRAAGTAAVTVLGTAAVAAVLLPRESARYWGGLFLDDTRVGGTAFPGNQSLRGLLARCLHTASVPAAVWVPVTVAVALLGLALAVVARRHLPGGPGDLAGASTAALTGLLVSPISWTHHWVWIVPGAVALAGLAARAPARRMWAPALVVAVMLAVPGRRAELTTSIPTGLVWRVPYRYGRELRLGGAELLVANTYVLLGLAALVAGAVVAVRRAARTTESPPAPAPRVRTDGAESLPIS